MDATATKPSYDLQFAQVAWVVKDIKAAETYFRETMKVTNLSKASITRLKDYKATYYGEPCEAENLVSMAYAGGTFIEIIQPLSGRSVFQDYLDKNPVGGVQHVAYRVPLCDFEAVLADFTEKGYPVVSTFDTPIAKIVFFDTTEDIGVMTEIMGITEQGEKAVEEMKSGKL